MVKENYIEVLTDIQKIKSFNSQELKNIIDEYPYFQSARALYLKALKDQKSFRYNNELKITAAYTLDRSVLFNFITSEIFSTATADKEINSNIDIEEIVSEEVKTPKQKIEQELEIGKPLTFTKNESYSFNQWLQLSSSITPLPKERDEKELQEDIINKFIANNPKISRIDKNAVPNNKPNKVDKEPTLMTETLARIYLEQKKYDSAIKAYEILSLKYPEKNSFFADQIKKIRNLQNIK